MRFFLLVYIFMLFASQPTFSMYGYGRSMSVNEIIGEDLFYDEGQRRAIRMHNARVIQQRVEMTEDFWEGITEFFSFFKRLFCSCQP